MNDHHQRKIAVIGLGYGGLPVAVAFSKQGPVIGYDKNTQRVADLKRGLDISREVESAALQHPNLQLTDNPADLAKADFYIVAVPTPIDEAKHPDLGLLLSASQTIGHYLKRGDIVVYESAVYPGATVNDCVPVLEETSGLSFGVDFTVGYSPERINPGDKQHRFETITKVVSGSDAKTLEIVAAVYGSVVPAGIYRAPDIRTAEAAKVIENTQRDLNIALMNELALIFKRMNIDTQEVLKAAGTKWNFIPFKPGLVGGHCTGVDPYYLTYQAQRFGYQPEVILAGRHINDSMGKYIAEQTIKQMIHAGCMIKGARVGILGLTFKENCPDLRNSKVIDIIHELQDYGIQCQAHDPIADPRDAKNFYDIKLMPWEALNDLDAIILAVAHDQFRQYAPADYQNKFTRVTVAANDVAEETSGLIIDVKSFLNATTYEAHGIKIWRL